MQSQQQKPSPLRKDLTAAHNNHAGNSTAKNGGALNMMNSTAANSKGFGIATYHPPHPQTANSHLHGIHQQQQQMQLTKVNNLHMNGANNQLKQNINIQNKGTKQGTNQNVMGGANQLNVSNISK